MRRCVLNVVLNKALYMNYIGLVIVPSWAEKPLSHPTARDQGPRPTELLKQLALPGTAAPWAAPEALGLGPGPWVGTIAIQPKKGQ